MRCLPVGELRDWRRHDSRSYGEVTKYQQSLSRASAVVLAIGVNDLKFRENRQIIENYSRILESLPQELPIICSAVLPVSEPIYRRSGVNNAAIAELNASLKALCPADPRRFFVDAGSRLIDVDGNLSAPFHEGDGIHLNAAGNRIWIDELRKALKLAAEAGAAQVRQPIRSERNRTAAGSHR